MRVARLEKQSSNRTASSKIKVTINQGGPRNKVESLTVKEIFAMAKSNASLGGPSTNYDGVANIIPNGMNGSKVNLICPATHWSCYFDMFDLIEALQASHPSEMEDLIFNSQADERDADDMAHVVKDYLQTSRGSFGGGLGRGWLVAII